MFLPAGTEIRLTSKQPNNAGLDIFLATVQEIPFDFDPDFINGIKVKSEKGKEIYVDDIHFKIDVIKYPREYYHPISEWYVLQGKLERFTLFCSDRIYFQNKWMPLQMNIVERISIMEYPTYRDAFKIYKIKYRLIA